MTDISIYTVLVVEDEPIILQDTVNEISNSDTNFQVIATATNGCDALSLYKELQPDLVITDIRMPIMDGLQLVEEVLELNPSQQIVILSGYNDFEYAQRGIKLGIKDYLLKPLDIDELIMLLNRLEKSLDQISRFNEQQLLFSKLNGFDFLPSIPFKNIQKQFDLYLVSIGNLFHHSLPSSVTSRVMSLWELIDWHQICTQVFNYSKQAWLVDDVYPNQKFIVTTIDQNNFRHDSEAIANKIQQRFQLRVSNLPINICHLNFPVTYDNIWDASQQLRWRLENSLIVGHSSIFSYDQSHVKPFIPYLDIDIQVKLKSALLSNNTANVKSHVFSLLENYDTGKVPQKKLEHNLMQITDLLIHYYQLESIADAVLIEHSIHTILFTASSISDVKEKIWESIDSKLLQARNLESFNIEDLVEQMIEYIKVNFTEDIKIEDLSKHFNFNGTYLSRIFKKHTGTSPMKYLSDFRINEAIQLIQSETEIDIKNISEMVGYTDPRYFSRIFKARTGLSPSEFKSNFYASDDKMQHSE